MGYQLQESSRYYFSGIFQNLIITILTALLFILLGQGIYSLELGSDADTGIVEFDSGLLFFLVVNLAIGSIIFYLIFTRLKSLGIRVIYSFVLILPYFILLFEIYTLLQADVVSQLEIYFYYAVSLTLPVFGLVFLYVYGGGLLWVKTRNLGIYISSAIIGRIIAIYFDLTGIVVFAILLSVFDIYSVFRGPLAKIMGKPERIDQNGDQRYLPPKEVMDKQFTQICKQGTPVVLSYQNTILGIGDVLFFSILIYKALLEWSWSGLWITLAMIIVGSSSTLYFLTKISPLPALPLPVVFSLLGYLILYLLETLF